MAEYRNPQQEPGGDKRMLMVFAVTFALIILGQIFLFKKPRATQQVERSNASEATQNSQAATQSRQRLPLRRRSRQQLPLPHRIAAKAASSEVETVVENDFYRIVFTNRGAQVKSWI